MNYEQYAAELETFFKAALENDIETLEKLLENGYRINRGDGDLYTALHRVCEHWSNDITSVSSSMSFSSHDTAKFLVSNGADVNADNPATDGWTAVPRSVPESMRTQMVGQLFPGVSKILAVADLYISFCMCIHVDA